MLALRLPIALLIGGSLTSGMFWVLWHLVGTEFDVSGMQEATRIEFSRMRRDTEVATKRDEKVERERPPPTPEAPRMAFSMSGVENNVAQLTPIVDARGAMSRMTMSAGSDRDVIPLVRINPDYPPRAQSRSRGFDSVFMRVEEGDDGIRRIYLKKPGPFTVVLILLAAGAVAALFFLLLAGLMLLWIPLIVIGILFAVFSISARDLWSRVQGWLGGSRR